MSVNMFDILGPITYGADNSEPFLGRDMGHIRDYSESTCAAIDSEIKRIISEAYARTENILKSHLDKLHEVAKYLYLNEKMSGEEFKRIMEEGSTPELTGGDSGAFPDTSFGGTSGNGPVLENG